MLVYQLSYLLLLPKFACDELIDDKWTPLVDGSAKYDQQCKPSYFCHNKDSIRWNYEPSPTTLTNFMTEWHLECQPSAYIAAAGESFLFGTVVGSFLAPYIINCFGQKNLVVASCIIKGSLNIVLLLLPKRVDLYWSADMMFPILFLGTMANFVGLIAGYQLFCDYAPQRRHAIMGTLWMVGEGMCTVIVSIYYWKISKNWAYLIWVVTGLYFILSILQMMMLVESPRLYYENKQYAECYDCMKYMGSFNRCGMQPKTLKLISDKDVLTKRESLRE